MKLSVRYIITRPCLSEGSLRLLKYLEAMFPPGGEVSLRDDRGGEYTAVVDRAAGRLLGLRPLYSSHNLGVNDVLLVTKLDEGRYGVECVVKPLQERSAATTRSHVVAEPPRRVIVGESAHVRAVRLERPAPPAEVAAPAPSEPVAEPVPAARPAARAGAFGPAAQAPQTVQGASPSVPVGASGAASAATAVVERPAGVSASSAADGSPEELLREFAVLAGYRFEARGGVARLRADLGAQSYTVLVATSPEGAASPAWRAEAEYRARLVSESERPDGARLTCEALVSLVESARLAPLTPLELRGYWNTGNVDLESAASVAELVSAQLSARGVFSFVLMTLAQHPAHSVVSGARLAERLGSGVNPAELGRVLETLCAPPFAALSPLGGGQYYLRSDVSDVLRSTCEYADGLRTRLNAETRVAALAR